MSARRYGRLPRVDRKALRCERRSKCSRGRGDGNMTLEHGAVVALLCLSGQTPDQNAEAVINEATLLCARDELGRVVARPRIVEASTGCVLPVAASSASRGTSHHGNFASAGPQGCR